MPANISGAHGSIGAQVDGAKQLARTLKKAGADMSKLKDNNKKVASIVMPVAQSKVPKKSGKLAKTIRIGATAKAGIVRAGNNGKVKYAGIIHYGWPQKNIKATPFLVNAAHQTEPEWFKVYKLGVDQAIASVKGK